MGTDIQNREFYKELKKYLPASTVECRRKWAVTMVENDMDLKSLSGLLQCEHKVATRFLWLLTEVGQINQDKLYSELPYLFDLCENLRHDYKQSFATFWRITGVPPENEAKAIDLLFTMLLSGETNITLKSRAALVLFRLTGKYPELKNELKLCLVKQLDNYSSAFKKRAARILSEIGS